MSGIYVIVGFGEFSVFFTGSDAAPYVSFRFVEVEDVPYLPVKLYVVFSQPLGHFLVDS